jgi:hypothetical protein
MKGFIQLFSDWISYTLRTFWSQWGTCSLYTSWNTAFVWSTSRHLTSQLKNREFQVFLQS